MRFDEDELARIAFFGELSFVANELGYRFKRVDVHVYEDRVNIVYKLKWYYVFHQKHDIRRKIEWAIKKELYENGLSDVRVNVSVK